MGNAASHPNQRRDAAFIVRTNYRETSHCDRRLAPGERRAAGKATGEEEGVFRTYLWRV